MRVLTSNNKVSLPFGYTGGKFYSKKNPHTGVDFSGWGDQSNYSPENGKVTKVGSMGACGLGINITGNSGDKYRICHNKKIHVKKGQKVKIAQKIGTLGATGMVSGKHNHTVMWRKGKRVDITKYAKIRPKEYLEDMEWKKKYTKLKAEYEKLVKSNKLSKKYQKEQDKLIAELKSTLTSTKQSNKDKTARIAEITQELQIVSEELKILKEDPNWVEKLLNYLKEKIWTRKP